MENVNLATPAPGWLPISRRLVEEICELFNLYADGQHKSLDHDLTKLLNVAHKLENFSRTRLTCTDYNNTKVWHDLRNLISIIMGYCELIQEEIDTIEENTLSDHLRNILILCNQLLQNSDNLPRDTQLQTHQPSRRIDTGVILVVDDQQESREILRRYLEQDNHQVLEADSGPQMFKIMEQHDIDLILLDLILPEMDGFDLLQALKHHDTYRAIPVIVVSGNKDRDRVIRCIEAGAEDYLFKPFNPILLRARINAGVERKHWHDKEERYREELERNQRFIRNIFGRYLSEEIVSTLLEDPDGLELGGVQRKVSVLMADIRGFTSITEKLPPHRVVRLLNNYLGTMSDVIMSFSGTVDEFIGDAILAIFGAPASREDDTDRAICCALQMQDAVTQINERNKAEDLPEISIGISINTGLVIAGNIGSKKRAKYGVVGHTVNQTARIEEHCPAGSILISQATLTDSQLLLSIGESKTIQAKGILEAIKIYELLAVSPSNNSDEMVNVSKNTPPDD